MLRKILFIISFMFLLSSQAFAAEVSVSLPEKVDVDGLLEVVVNVSTDGELINGAKIVLDYDENLLEFVGYKEEGSLIGLWVEHPQAKDGYVSFSGVIPGGVVGLFDPEDKTLAPIPLARMLFMTKSGGVANFSFQNSEILKHDGRGSLIEHSRSTGQVSIVGGDSSGVKKIFDSNPPVDFEVSFIESGFFSRTPSMVLFNARDLESGVKEYKIAVPGLGWRNAESPHPVARSIFSYNLHVRAYDFSGNFSEALILIPGLVSVHYVLIFVIVLGLCFVGLRMIKLKL